MIRLTIIAGARPNFMKIAPLVHEINRSNQERQIITYRLVHTGQHYDKKMSEEFFTQLNIPEPNVNLKGGGGTQAEQTAHIMIAFEKELMENPADLVIVVGDVTSTLACSIVAKKLNTKVAHIEGGIRSGDLSMPEEINRMVTDSISDYFFTTSEVANKNLIKLGVSEDRIFWVGNTMIDTLLNNISNFIKPKLESLQYVNHKEYIVLTLHRPSNVDDSEILLKILSFLCNTTENQKIIFPAHPRTAKKLNELDFKFNNLIIVEPLSYFEFNYLVLNSLGVVTDSGGVTEETSVMNIPCLTLRDTTERPETVTHGTNILIGNDYDKLESSISEMIAGNWKSYQNIPFWDGNTSKRIVKIIIDLFK